MIPPSRRSSPYTSVFNNYVRTELEYKSDARYGVLEEQVEEKWDWGSGIAGFPNTATALRQALVKNPYLKVLVMKMTLLPGDSLLRGELHHRSPGFGNQVPPEHLDRGLRVRPYGVSADR